VTKCASKKSEPFQHSRSLAVHQRRLFLNESVTAGCFSACHSGKQHPAIFPSASWPGERNSNSD